MNVAIKPYPACHLVHACIDAAIEIQREHGLTPDAIEDVEALVPAEVVKIVCEPVEQKQSVGSAYEAQFSIPYAVASGLVRRRFDLEALAPAALGEPAVRALARRVRYSIDSKSGFPTYYSGEVVVRTKDGRRLGNRQHKNRGCSDRPLSPAEVAEKFHANADPVIGASRADAVAERILGLERLGSVRELEAALAG
jgi:2-methylcitrate dehydratase PrpD